MLIGLFFIAIGMTRNLALLWSNPLRIVVLALGLVFVKTAIITAILRWRHVSLKEGVQLGLMLSQGGEFAFVVIAAALSFSLLDPDIAQFMLLVVIVTMFLTPALADIGHRVGDHFRTTDSENPVLMEASDVSQTVIIGGFGRVGEMLARLLEEQRIPFIAVDNDAELVAKHRALGTPIFFGDAGQPDVLRHLGIENAAAFATTMDAPKTAEHVIKAIHQKWPHVPIIARARDVEHALTLRGSGAKSAIPETMEASLELCEHLLTGIGFPDDVARTLVNDQRTWQQESMDQEQDR